MTARFGRNKRRAAAARIADLERHMASLATAKAVLERQVLTVERAMDRARTEALHHFMQSGGYYHHLLDKLVREAGHAAGREFGKQAESAMARALSEDRRNPFSARLDEDPTRPYPVDVFSVHVPAMQMRLAAPQWEARLYASRPEPSRPRPVEPA